jgi:Trypsin-co-occurring domain 2
VRQLRGELGKAMTEAKDERLRSELGPVEPSLTVTVGRGAKPVGKIRFWVVEAGADATISREAVQDIKLVLTPGTCRRRSALTGSWPLPPIDGQQQPDKR